MKHHWMEDADRITTDEPGWQLLIGECDNGDLWVWEDWHPYLSIILPGEWVRFSRWNAKHRLAYRRSRRARKVVWLVAS